MLPPSGRRPFWQFLAGDLPAVFVGSCQGFNHKAFPFVETIRKVLVFAWLKVLRSLRGIRCSDWRETREGEKCCKDQYWIFLQHMLNKFDHAGPSNTKHRVKEMESTGHANLPLTAALFAVSFLKRFTRNTCRKTNQTAAKLEYNLSHFQFPRFPC